MKRKRFSIKQIVAVLKQDELGMPVADAIRQVGISEQTFYRCKKQYADMQSDQVRELKQLQEYNARLKKLVAELSLDKAILQDVASKTGAARVEATGRCARHEPLPSRQTSGLHIGQVDTKHRLPLRHQRPTLGPTGPNARGIMREVAHTRVRYGLSLRREPLRCRQFSLS